jgi:hypothetical protein
LLEDTDEIESYLNSLREKLATPELAASCKQEMYDYSIEEIIQNIKDPDVYLDPKLFISLLEHFFGMNIFVFNRTNSINEQLVIPRYAQAYYRNKKDANCIFIYEHAGTSSSETNDFQCELVVKWKIHSRKDKDIIYSFPYTSDVSQGIIDVFNKMRKAYSLNLEIKETIFPIPSDFFEQGIDFYGKCRMLRIMYKEQLVTLLTEPMQPFAVTEKKDWCITKIKKELAYEFFRDYLMIPISKQTIYHSQLKELHGIVGNVNIRIPIEDSKPMEGIPHTSEFISYSDSSISVLANHNHYKKIARYIVEYMFWLFSMYIKRTDKSIDSEDSIVDFVDEKIQIDPNFEYGYVSNIFHDNSGVMKEGKLVVKSRETLKRLIYTLRLHIRRFREKIENYYDKKMIEKYYQDITDFDHYSFQVLLQGDESISNWIQEQKIKYVIHDSVQLHTNIPYFFQNGLISEKVYLAQNTNTIKKAIEIGKTWKEDGYNIAEEANDCESQWKITLYKYINSDSIVPYKVSGISNKWDIRIMGYKINGVSFFTVLLHLSYNAK